MLMIYYSVTNITKNADDGQVQEILQQFRSLRGSLGDALKWMVHGYENHGKSTKMREYS